MTFKNTSKYPDDEVRSLVTFALRNIDHRKVAVHVKNLSHGFARGRAYQSIPYMSPLARRKHRRMRYLITIGIGAEKYYPYTGRYRGHDNDPNWPLVEHRDWREGLVGVAAHEAQHIKQFQCKMPISELEAERVEAKRLVEYRREILGDVDYESVSAAAD